MHLVAGPVDAALRENESVQVFGQDFVHALDVEAGEVQHPVVTRVRNETDVVAEPRDIDDGFAFVLVLLDRSERDAAVRRSLRALDRDAIAAEDVDGHAGQRQTGLDRDHENIAGLVSVFLHQQSEVADENEPRRRDAFDEFFRDWVPRARLQEEQAALAAAVRGFLEILREIERGIVRLPFVLERDRLVFARDPRNVVLVERRVLEFRRLEFALRLADEMVDLRGENAIDLELDHGHAAGPDR